MIIFVTSYARSCTESALSEVVIIDLGLLPLEMSIDKDVDSRRVGCERLHIWVMDKNGQALSLLEGRVDANGTEFSIKKSKIKYEQ